ncbi:hypothetical protein [Bacillus sp. T33-2]|uniref:hypothetical protein n=1 Tax=Bacillus sp. T33-2 TaxID=2054168 RepID=UPI00115A56FB|nr:hypothetical protein [Bacillus sp. T33-2]
MLTYTGTGDWKDGEFFPEKRLGYPLNLPIKIDFELEDPSYGLPLSEIQNVVISFRPIQGMSYHKICSEEFGKLEKTLKDIYS